MAEPIYLRSKHGSLTQACDEDTRYWIFDDSPEPVGLTCHLKADGYYTRMSALEWETEQAVQRANRGAIDDGTIAFWDAVLRRHAQESLAYGRFEKPT